MAVQYVADGDRGLGYERPTARAARQVAALVARSRVRIEPAPPSPPRQPARYLKRLTCGHTAWATAKQVLADEAGLCPKGCGLHQIVGPA